MKIHFIAIGGAIMHQLALALHRKGYQVTGSDDEINNPAKSNLENNGLLPKKMGWYAERITSDLDGVILGMHAKADNPELLKAQELGLKIYSFPEYIYEFSKSKKRVVIAGSHGKTTTTSMIMHVLKDSGLAFDYMVGAKVEGFDQSVHLSDAPLIILEGDEYPASVIEKQPKIHFYHPHISVLTGIAWDHINVFPTFENYIHQFNTYLNFFDSDTHLIYNEEDENVNNLIKKFYGKFQLTPYQTPEFIISDHKVAIQAPYGEQELQIFGNHNIQNMEAARLVCNDLGVDDIQFYKSIATFKGAARRFEKINDRENFVSYRDFAHAPSKLKATLNGARNQFADKHLIACFELHTYSSLNQAFLNEYKDAMKNCDVGAVFYSKHALELKGLPNLSVNDIKKGFGDNNLNVINDKNELRDWIQAEIQKTEKPIVLLLMSSGTFDGMDIEF
jgi:UDP-N-acetylmuramate: L-alanyl-gamma-D-glutamyl-meso-diaminopimelate ligase